MKSNEEYLDDLLQSMNPEEEGSTGENKTGLENLSDIDMSALDALLQEDETIQKGNANDEDDSLAAEELSAEDLMENQSSLDIQSLPQTDEPQEKIQEREDNSMLAQLMAEMQEESFDDEKDDTDYEDGFAEDIDALLDAAKNSSEETGSNEDVTFDAENAEDLAEIEALLNMSDGNGSVEDNMELLRMLEEQEKETAPLKKEEPEDVDVAKLEEILSVDSDSGDNSGAEKDAKEENKKKESGRIKKFFKKIVNALMEEIPEEEEEKKLEQDMNLSEENKEILEELDKEEEEKVKVKEKKEKKAKKEKPKKPKKEKPKKEKKAKATETEIPEKKLPKKHIIVTFVLAFSILLLLLLIEIFAVPAISLKSARKAFDSGDYSEAYKEYYGHKLSDEDEVKFEAATVIMRMQSNIDAYQNYMNLGNKVYALHSLLEAVHIKHDAFFKAEEFGVLSKVESIYNEVLEILNSSFHVSEAEAMEIVEEASDAVYTRKLEALAGTAEVSEAVISTDDILPEEENILED